MQRDPSMDPAGYDAPTWPGHASSQPGYAPQPMEPPVYAPQQPPQPPTAYGAYGAGYAPNSAPPYAAAPAAYAPPPRYRRSRGAYGLGGLFRFVAGLLLLAISVLEMALLVRIGLRLFGANPDATFTSLIYTWTAAWVAPFQGVFPSYTTPLGGPLETAAVLAMVVYALGERIVETLLRMLARR